MASILGCDRNVVEEICNKARRSGEILQVANLLCPGNIAISGHVGSLEDAEIRRDGSQRQSIYPLECGGCFPYFYHGTGCH